MKKKGCKSLVFALASGSVLVLGMGNAYAYESITAQEAYDMAVGGDAVLLDVRTLEECMWIGSPAFVPGGTPISYVIPWQFEVIDAGGTITKPLNPDFDALVEQTFMDKAAAIITFCRSGGRSSSASERLEYLGYTNVYEIDNAVKGGNGGFQGSNYADVYAGYRGYPERLPSNMDPNRIKVQTDSDRITNPDDSVAWMDTGLPVTQKIDKAKIPALD